MNSVGYPHVTWSIGSNLTIGLATVNSKIDIILPNDVLRSEENNDKKTDKYEDGCETQ